MGSRATLLPASCDAGKKKFYHVHWQYIRNSGYDFYYCLFGSLLRQKTPQILAGRPKLARKGLGIKVFWFSKKRIKYFFLTFFFRENAERSVATSNQRVLPNSITVLVSFTVKIWQNMFLKIECQHWKGKIWVYLLAQVLTLISKNMRWPENDF
jgi:hypothetical protein